MTSTPTPKIIESHDALIARADEQLARVTEQLATMERDSARPASAGPSPQSALERPGLAALVGLPLAACVVVAALVLQSSYGGEAKLVVARSAPQRVSTPSLLRKSAVSCAARSIYRSTGRGGGNTTANNALGTDRTARGRADSYRSASRPDTVAANDRTRSR